MHALTNTLHRPPPATRPRVRWQPYTATILSSNTLSTPRSPTTSQLKSPSTSVTSPPPSSSSKSELDRPRPLHTQSVSTLTTIKDTYSKENPKSKIAQGLIEQAIRSLSEIWRPQDIPPSFSPASGNIPLIHTESTSILCMRNLQLPSPPITPSTSPTAAAAAQSAKQPLTRSTPSLVATIAQPPNPMKGFIHEVLRRSRTSGCVLQTALCYLEAIRVKVPELSRQYKARDNQEPRLAMPDGPGLTPHTQYDRVLEPAPTTASDLGHCSDDTIPTIRISDSDVIPGYSDSTANPIIETASPSSDEVSPLLCPRRTFLASLILASKFMQDKCYSNRAWAKLSGLPPREISRCERALGEALEWRLWVGKPTPQVASPLVAQRPVIRCQSASALMSCSPPAALSPIPPAFSQGNMAHGLSVPPGRALRRAHTQPVAYVLKEDIQAVFIPHPIISTREAVPEHQQMSVVEVPRPIMEHTSSTLGSQLTNTSSPGSSTPGLSYSPTTTESSSGELTVQMTSFLDDSSFIGLSQDIGQWHDGCDQMHPSIQVEVSKVLDPPLPQLEVSPCTW